MQIINDPKLDFKDVLIMPKVSSLGSRSDVDITRQFKYKGRDGEHLEINCVPIIASNMDGVGTFSMVDALAKHNCMTAVVKSKTVGEWKKWLEDATCFLYKKNFAFISIGMMDDSDLEDLAAFLWTIKWQQPKICIDVANGYNQNFVDFVARARETFQSDAFIMAGNVVTPSQTEALIMAGANAVKVGIGSGSVCTTRKVTGIGYPQLSAIIECADAAHGLNGFVVADGGCQVPGDVCKAFGAGADFVMLGGMLAGHDESEYRVPDANGKFNIPFHGSSSKAAQTQNGNEMAEYRSSEGKEVMIEAKGPVDGTIKHILGGLRSCCTYVGAAHLKELSKRTTFVRVYNGAQYNTVFGDSNEVS